MPAAWIPYTGIARPHGRARIETRPMPPTRTARLASPGLTVGRGLKLQPGCVCTRDCRIARPHGRARIETICNTRASPTSPASPGLTVGRGLKHLARDGGCRGIRGIARPHGRARIETTPTATTCCSAPASPGLTVGRGLKHHLALDAVLRQPASPGLTVGRGLKQQERRVPADH